MEGIVMRTAGRGETWLGLLKRSLYRCLPVFFSGSIIFCLISCSFLLLDEGSPADVTFKKSNVLLVVVDGALLAELRPALEMYYADLSAGYFQVYSYTWTGGDAGELKTVLDNYYQTHKIGGALLVGNLPAVWYEMDAFGMPEEFPCDLYFMDLDSLWLDRDDDGLFDAHSRLSLDIYTSRIMGTSTELAAYLAKVHRFRTGDLYLGSSAYIFKDDDWAYYDQGYDFGLDQIYRNINICEKINDTVKPAYISTLTGSGAEYVYQWIHSHPGSLCVENNGQYQYIDLLDINTFNFKGLFFNLFDCSASRFTQDNIAMGYLLKTDYALATLGSTKVGGNYYPLSFNIALAKGGSWGDAFRVWYNYYGITDDSWFMGMMILGDPALKVSKRDQPLEIFRSLSLQPAPGKQEISELEAKIRKDLGSANSEGFAAYKARNPQFFK